MSNSERWDFIAKWLSDYSSSSKVTYSDDLDCYINGQTDNSQYERLKKEFPNIEDAVIEQEKIDCELYLEAYQDYIRAMISQIDERKAILLQNLDH